MCSIYYMDSLFCAHFHVLIFIQPLYIWKWSFVHLSSTCRCIVMYVGREEFCVRVCFEWHVGCCLCSVLNNTTVTVGDSVGAQAIFCVCLLLCLLCLCEEIVCVLTCLVCTEHPLCLQLDAFRCKTVALQTKSEKADCQTTCQHEDIGC